MRLVIDKLFVRISYIVLKGPGVRARTQFVFVQFIFICSLVIELLLFKFFLASAVTGAILLLASLPFSWIISRPINKYVNDNWNLFSPKSKDRVSNLWVYRIAVYFTLMILLVGFVFSGCWWSIGLVAH